MHKDSLCVRFMNFSYLVVIKEVVLFAQLSYILILLVAFEIKQVLC